MFITISTDGELVEFAETATAAAVAKAVGGTFDLVRVKPRDMYGFVNDDGHATGLPRNPVGSCLLVALKATAYVYAGPVVLTGWEDHGEPDEIRDLNRAQADLIAGWHEFVMLALEGKPAANDREFALQLPGYAEHVRTAPTPTLHFVGLSADKL